MLSRYQAPIMERKGRRVQSVGARRGGSADNSNAFLIEEDTDMRGLKTDLALCKGCTAPLIEGPDLV